MEQSDITDKYKPFWHELTDNEINDILKKPITWSDIVKTFRQPEWCNYPDALNGSMGCWSLTDVSLRKKINIEYCRTCDCYKGRCYNEK